MMETLSEDVRLFLEGLGIDAMHAAAVLSVIFMFGYKNDIENWDDIRLSAKVLIISGAIATIFLCAISILRLVGIIDL